MMHSFSDIIDAFGYISLADSLGAPRVTVNSWKQRNTLPAPHWSEVVALAKEKDISGVTLEVLATLAAKRAQKNEAA